MSTKLELRKPGQRSMPSEDAIARLEGRAEGIASKAPGAPTPVAVAPAKSRSRLRRDEGGERITAYLPPEIAESLRIRCAKERRSVSDAVTDALRVWLQGVQE